MTLTTEQRDAVISAIEQGKSLRSAAKLAGIASETSIRKLVVKDAAFGAQYTQARDLGLDTMADEMLALVDCATPEQVNVAKLQFEARRWYLSKLAPKRYSDKLDLSATVAASVTLVTTPTDEAL